MAIDAFGAVGVSADPAKSHLGLVPIVGIQDENNAGEEDKLIRGKRG